MRLECFSLNPFFKSTNVLKSLNHPEVMTVVLLSNEGCDVAYINIQIIDLHLNRSRIHLGVRVKRDIPKNIAPCKAWINTSP